MGNSINKAREEAIKTSKQSEQTFNDAMNMLYEMAEEKMKTFELEVFSNTSSQKEIPMEAKLLHESTIRCSVAQS